jgi:hypothetical protein
MAMRFVRLLVLCASCVALLAPSAEAAPARPVRLHGTLRGTENESTDLTCPLGDHTRLVEVGTLTDEASRTWTYDISACLQRQRPRNFQRALRGTFVVSRDGATLSGAVGGFIIDGRGGVYTSTHLHVMSGTGAFAGARGKFDVQTGPNNAVRGETEGTFSATLRRCPGCST